MVNDIMLNNNSVVPSEVKLTIGRQSLEPHLRNLIFQSANGNINKIRITEMPLDDAGSGYRSKGELELIADLCKVAKQESETGHKAKRALRATLEECKLKQDELPAKGASAIRLGKDPKNCSVAYDISQSIMISSAMLNNREDLFLIWQQYLAIHEGSHCDPKSTRGKLLTPLDVAKMPSRQRADSDEFGELYAHSKALLHIIRDSTKNGWFDKTVPELFSIVKKYYASSTMSSAPYNRLVSWFDAFEKNRNKLDHSKIASLSDEKIDTLSSNYAKEVVAGKASRKSGLSLFSTLTTR